MGFYLSVVDWMEADLNASSQSFVKKKKGVQEG